MKRTFPLLFCLLALCTASASAQTIGTIQIKRGTASAIAAKTGTAVKDGEPAYATDTKQIYVGYGGVYNLVAGANGTPGSTWYNGTGVPASATGVNGDYYLNTATSDVYQKSAGAWVLIENIKGAAGTNGINGSPGAPGVGYTLGTASQTAHMNAGGTAFLTDSGVLNNGSQIAVGGAIDAATSFTAYAPAATTVPINIKAAASQTANLLNLSSSTGTGDLDTINNHGDLLIQGAPLTVGGQEMQFSVGGYANMGGVRFNGSDANDNNVYQSTNGDLGFATNAGDVIFKPDYSKYATNNGALVVKRSALIGLNLNNPSAQFHILSLGATTIDQIIQEAAAQTSDVIDVNSNAGTGGDLLKVSSAGVLRASGYQSSDGSAGATGTSTGGEAVKNGLVTGLGTLPVATATVQGIANFPTAGGLTVAAGAVSEAQPITAIGSGLSLTAGTLSSTAGGGSVTSVGLALPSIFTVTGSPITGAGTLTGALASETANTFLAAPNGAAGTPIFRLIAAADLPIATATAVGGVKQGAGTTIAADGTLSVSTSYQAPGNYLTALTGDVAASGPGSAAATLASVGTAGTYAYPASVTTDAKGRVTAVTAGSAPTNGTVTSVGLALPSIFTVTGSPVTASGTLTGALATQTANTIFAGPASGAAAAPAFRAIVAADLPATTGTVKKFAAALGAITAGTSIVLSHGLGTADCTWNVVDVNGKSVYPDVVITATTISITFQSSYAANSFRVIVEG